MTIDSRSASLKHQTDSRQSNFHATTQVTVASTRSPHMPSALASDEDTGPNHIPSWPRAVYTNTSMSQDSDMSPAQHPGQSIPGGNTASVYTSHLLPSPESAIAALSRTRAEQRSGALSNSDCVGIQRDVQHTAMATALIPGPSAPYHSDGTDEPGWIDDSWNS
ncbi:hypothetical protein PHLGIDRAFT_184336 [Phlebiopsis gigantea 11061_1 CR5-6]|uniref:Uncharacterized protein n=1 Tax=Phlebiopsis gigantea (strain 11061_1 CR5-6) TaxID=745531 RepID=A0A0C3SCF5_PHLG1|nr:hypothetical protein PHLGIDRAFT_184336 [Phlebiopsis gigantea 11061_1 CR5-6]